MSTRWGKRQHASPYGLLVLLLVGALGFNLYVYTVSWFAQRRAIPASQRVVPARDLGVLDPRHKGWP